MKAKPKWPTWLGIPLNVLYFCGVLIVASDVVPLVWNNSGLTGGVLSARLEGLMVGFTFVSLAIRCILDALKSLQAYLESKEADIIGDTE